MSRRTLGGGRVLGSGKSLSPAAPVSPVPQQQQQQQRLSHHLSPSASTLSLNSQTSTPPSSGSQDIASRVSIDHADSSISVVGAAAAAAGARMVCPICNEEMVTLLQLNRHLDDAHKNLEDERQDEVKDWFKAQMVKAKKFQPLAVLNQKLKGLDVFESNAELGYAQAQAMPMSRGHSGVGAGGGQSTPEHGTPRTTTPQYVDPDEVVTRDHWQRRGTYDDCSEPTCGKRLNATNGAVNCRHCGKLFCEEHTMYQMKLSRSAKYEPVRGIWCRVCETCYKSREGYNDHNGFERNHMTEFTNIRRQAVDKTYLEVSRLEKRLTKLTQLLTNPPTEMPAQMSSTPNNNKRWSLAWVQNDPRKALEQSVVSWQDDNLVSKCPYCHQEFTGYTFRRHHCRTCGKVVCGDIQTGCSMEIPLNVNVGAANSNSNNKKEKTVVTPGKSQFLQIEIRLCKECKSTIFDRQDFEAQLKHKPPDARAYENLIQFERGIRRLLPTFQKLLTALQDPERPPSATELAEASKVRKRLTDSFTQYDIAARRIRDLPTDSPTQKKLQKAIHQQATNFLHLHMLPLKALPKILKHATPHGRALVGANGGRPVSALASIKYNDKLASGDAASETSSRISVLEAEEKSLKEQLIVLEEQKFFVSEMIADANKRRKFDEVAALQGNLEDLSKEIDSVQGMLGQLDFEGAYTGVNSSPMILPQK